MFERNKLLPREQVIYNYLIDCYNKGDYQAKTKEEIAHAVGFDAEKKYKRLINCIDSDIHNINKKRFIKEIIISSSKGYRVANEFEALEYIKQKFNRYVSSAEEIYSIADKLNFDTKKYSKTMTNLIYEMELSDNGGFEQL